MNYLDEIVIAQKQGKSRGVTSICSAHPLVIEAALRHGLEQNDTVLIEATCNQVNPFGGYTGMKPVDFVRFVEGIARRVGFPQERLLLGGDHLGPLPWVKEPAESAMEKAKTMVREYVRAGFRKIHLDCSMPCWGEAELPDETIAMRIAILAREAEMAYLAADRAKAGLTTAATGWPRYVIGTEVPPAGGAKAGEGAPQVTSPAAAAETIALAREAFLAQDLEAAWERVIALVVQPGVEFGDAIIHDYNHPAAEGLSRFIETIPGMIYEAHSTDYQTRSALRALVADHFGILKVGPALTFALREAIFALAEMEDLLVQGEPSRLRQIIEKVMVAKPGYWQGHYGGAPQAQRFSRVYSFSDRIRYYWAFPEVQAAFAGLMANLGDWTLPLSVLSARLPRQYEKIRLGRLENHPRALIIDRVRDVLEDYTFACSSD